MSRIIFNTKNVIWLFLFLFSCQLLRHRKIDKEFSKEYVYDLKYEKCFNEWTFKDLREVRYIQVLYFSHFTMLHMSNNPTWLIGLSEEMDTVAIIDLSFNGKIKKDKIVTVRPRQWSKDEKELSYPHFVIFRTRNENELLCAVKTAYYGEIDTTGR